MIMIIWPTHSLRRASACSQAEASCLGSVRSDAANDGEREYYMVQGTLPGGVLAKVSRLGRMLLLGYEDDAWAVQRVSKIWRRGCRAYGGVHLGRKTCSVENAMRW
jgi:hypothetical protein